MTYAGAVPTVSASVAGLQNGETRVGPRGQA